MEENTDILAREYSFSADWMPSPLRVELDAATYTNNGTLAVSIMRKELFPEEIEETGMDMDLSGFREYMDTLTVNLPGSDSLPLDTQFVDENNLPGIGEWLEKNGIATPTGMMARSGWCLYPAYQFNITGEKLQDVLDRRMSIDPRQTEIVLADSRIAGVNDIRDSLDSCRTVGELRDAWERMPDGIRREVEFPGKDSPDRCRDYLQKGLDRIVSGIEAGKESLSAGKAMRR